MPHSATLPPSTLDRLVGPDSSQGQPDTEVAAQPNRPTVGEPYQQLTRRCYRFVDPQPPPPPPVPPGIGTEHRQSRVLRRPVVASLAQKVMLVPRRQPVWTSTVKARLIRMGSSAMVRVCGRSRELGKPPKPPNPQAYLSRFIPPWPTASQASQALLRIPPRKGEGKPWNRVGYNSLANYHNGRGIAKQSQRPGFGGDCDQSNPIRKHKHNILANMLTVGDGLSDRDPHSGFGPQKQSWLRFYSPTIE